MARPACQPGAQRRQGLDHEPGFAFQPTHVGHTHFEPASQHLQRHLLRVHQRQLHLQPRMDTYELGQRARHDGLAGEGAGADGQRTFFQPGEQADLAAQVGRAVQHRRPALEQQAAEGSGHHLLVRAVEEPHAQRLLQLGDAARDAGLRQVQRFRRAGEAAVLSQGDRQADQAQVVHHAFIVSIVNECVIDQMNDRWNTRRPAGRAALDTRQGHDR
jgi:hypothetical protein